MSKIDTGEMRDHMSIMGISIPTDDDWVFDTLQETLNEIDRLRGRLELCQNYGEEPEVIQQIEQRTKEACKEAAMAWWEEQIKNHIQPNLHIMSKTSLKQAIDSVGRA